MRIMRFKLLYNDIVFNTLKSLSQNVDKPKITGFLPKPYGVSHNKRYSGIKYNLRSEAFLVNKVYPDVGDVFSSSRTFFAALRKFREPNLMTVGANKFVLSDNLSSPTKLEYECSTFKYTPKGSGSKGVEDPYCYYHDSEALWGPSKINRFSEFKRLKRVGKRVGQASFVLKIPQNDMSKYTNFRVEPKQ